MTYDNGVQAKLRVPKSSSANYLVSIEGQETVPGFFVPSHRSVYRYQQITQIPATRLNKEQAFGRVWESTRGRYFGGSDLPSSYHMKEVLIAWRVYWGDVEHHRPKAVFPLLEFDWQNLGFVCARCNNEKSDKWSDETPFIDPFLEEPDEHLRPVGPFVFHRNLSERGEYTWLQIGLNRADLVERRLERIGVIRALIDKVFRTKGEELRGLILRQLERELEDDKEYAMVSREAYRQLRSRPEPTEN